MLKVNTFIIAKTELNCVCFIDLVKCTFFAASTLVAEEGCFVFFISFF